MSPNVLGIPEVNEGESQRREWSPYWSLYFQQKKSFPKADALLLGTHVYDQTPNAGQSSTKTTKTNNQSLLFPLTPSSQCLD